MERLMPLLVLAFTACGCVHDEPEDAPEHAVSGPEYTDIVVRLNVANPAAGTPDTRSGQGTAGTKAGSILDPDEDEYTLGFTKEEHRIHSLTLIMTNVRPDGSESFDFSQTVMTDAAQENAGTISAIFNLSGKKGRKRFYVGANMSQKHIGAFTVDGQVIDLPDDSEGHSIVGQLMEIDHTTGAGSRILMTGRVIGNNGQTDFDLTELDGQFETSREDDAITISVKEPVRLTKAVSKVLMTCQTYSGSGEDKLVQILDAKDQEEGTDTYTGWLHLENVRYILNVLNRKTYAVYREALDGSTPYLADPNLDMSGMVEKRTSTADGSETYGPRDLEDYLDNFVYYDTQHMVEMLTSDTPPDDGDCRRSVAAEYDKSRLGADAVNHYTDGLYCPENMVHKDITFGPDENDEFTAANHLVSTHIVIGGKYVPRIVWILENEGQDDEKLVQHTSSTEEESAGLLESDLNEDLGVTYEDGTFWYEINDHEYYTYRAMEYKTLNDPEAVFTRHDGGWGYWFSMIEGQNENGVISNWNQEYWGLKRNHYYIVNVTRIITPGSSSPGNEAMMVHSELLDWIDQGGENVEVTVPQK